MRWQARLAALVLVTVCAACGRTPVTAAQEIKIHRPEDLAIGKTAPDIVAEDLEGVQFKLSDYRGKVVVLDFWGDW